MSPISNDLLIMIKKQQAGIHPMVPFNLDKKKITVALPHLHAVSDKPDRIDAI